MWSMVVSISRYVVVHVVHGSKYKKAGCGSKPFLEAGLVGRTERPASQCYNSNQPNNRQWSINNQQSEIGQISSHK